MWENIFKNYKINELRNKKIKREQKKARIVWPKRKKKKMIQNAYSFNFQIVDIKFHKSCKFSRIFNDKYALSIILFILYLVFKENR